MRRGDIVHSTVQSVFRASDWTVKTVSTVYKDCCAELVIITQHFTDNFQTHSNTMATEEKKKLDIDKLEDDDEFEEFPTDDWDIRQEDQTDIQVWEDSWDDEDTDSDFAKHLRSELESQGNIQDQK